MKYVKAFVICIFMAGCMPSSRLEASCPATYMPIHKASLWGKILGATKSCFTCCQALRKNSLKIAMASAVIGGLGYLVWKLVKQSSLIRNLTRENQGFSQAIISNHTVIQDLLTHNEQISQEVNTLREGQNQARTSEQINQQLRNTAAAYIERYRESAVQNEQLRCQLAKQSNTIEELRTENARHLETVKMQAARIAQTLKNQPI